MTIKISEIFPSLSKRQREVCALLIKGYSHKEIGRDLGCSARTIEDHVQNILVLAQVQDSRRLIYRAFGAPEVLA